MVFRHRPGGDRVGVTAALHDDDWILPLHRNLGVFTTRGVDLERLFRQLLFKEGGFTGGRDRTFHFGLLDHHIVGMISHLAAMLPVADGLALAAQLRGEPRVAAAFVGDGGTSEGDFHEAVNLAAVWKLPVIFVVENNQYGLSTPVREQFAVDDLASRGAGYGIPGVDLRRQRSAGGAPRDQRSGRARPPRRRADADRVQDLPHARPRGGVGHRLRAAGAVRRVARARSDRALRAASSTTPACCRRRRATRCASSSIAEIDAIADRVIGAPEPQSTAARELADVYAPRRQRSRSRAAAAIDAAPEMRYVDAITDALRLRDASAIRRRC